jgi:hypothetical protein
MYQWADTATMARGRRSDRANSRHARVYRLSSSAFIGLPWPTKIAGMTLESVESVESDESIQTFSRRFDLPGDVKNDSVNFWIYSKFEG